MKFFKRFRASLRLREAIRQADKAHKETGERYYVMPATSKRGETRLLIMDRRNFRKLKQKRYISRNAMVRHLERECFYCTPYKELPYLRFRLNSGLLSEDEIKAKRQAYFNWLGL